MKKIILTSVLFQIFLSVIGQVSLDSTGYKAYLVSAYAKNGQYDSNSDILFFFTENKMVSSINDQTKVLYYKTAPKKIDLEGHNSLMIECVDNGGFGCTLNLGYVEKSNVYFISIKYSNILFFYECVASDERPWDSDPEEIPVFEPWDGTYTDEQVDAFLKQFGNPKILKKAILNDLYFNILK